MTRPRRLLISISARSICGRRHASWLKMNLRKAHRLLRTPLMELSVALIGRQKMRQLHSQFLGSRRTTDVMSFPLEFDSLGRPISGEIVICVSEARRRSRQLGITLRKELLLYALHGMLHLCGFDDKTRRQSHFMHAKEDAILRRLGVGPVFAVKGRR